METITYKNIDIKIEQDMFPEDPRVFSDELGTMVCHHNRYSLGDSHNYSVEETIKLSEHPDYIAIPLYLYDHSGITMATRPFECQWDSGQVGFIMVSKAKARKELGYKYLTNKRILHIVQLLQNEVDEYDAYITGNVHGYVIDEIDESCFGFYGDYRDYMIAQAKGAIDYHIEMKLKEANELQLELGV